MVKIYAIIFFVVNCVLMGSEKGEQYKQEFAELVEASQIVHTTYGKPVAHLPNKIGVIAGDDEIKKELIVKQAKNVHPIMHGDVPGLITNFLQHKKQYGTDKEKAVYDTINTAPQFIKRLLTKRPLMFMSEFDVHLLKDGTLYLEQAFKPGPYPQPFELIGTNREKKPFILNDYISYDEMAISALIGVSVPTFFINNGRKYNNGALDKEGAYEKSGVFVGLVGARFEKLRLMEAQHMLVTKEQNTVENGYGYKNTSNSLLRIWSEFYGLSFPTYQEARDDTTGRYVWVVKEQGYLDTFVYQKRMEMSILPFLIDANKRAQEKNTSAYCHVVGLGIGVWQIDKETQVKCILRVYKDLIQNNEFKNIADIDFAWFPDESPTYNIFVNESSVKGIKIHFSKRNPADKLTGSDEGKLLVAMYPWDANAGPGNEYWHGDLSASMDPAAAACSTISELQNPDINHFMIDNIENMYVGISLLTSTDLIKAIAIANIPKMQIDSPDLPKKEINYYYYGLLLIPIFILVGLWLKKI